MLHSDHSLPTMLFSPPSLSTPLFTSSTCPTFMTSGWFYDPHSLTRAMCVAVGLGLSTGGLLNPVFLFYYVLISTDTAVLSPKIKEYQQSGVIYSVAEIIKASKNM